MSVSRDDWITAGLRSFRRGGTDAVNVEALARDLDVTKGSFYWHFADRRELLEELLRLWEVETENLVAQASKGEKPLERVLRFFTMVADHRGEVPDTEYFAWARRDLAVAKRADAVEAQRIAFIRTQLLSAGIAPREAERRAEAGYLSTLGWIDRASRTRTRGPVTDFSRFTAHLFDLLFAGVDMRREWNAYRRGQGRASRV